MADERIVILDVVCVSNGTLLSYYIYPDNSKAPNHIHLDVFYGKYPVSFDAIGDKFVRFIRDVEDKIVDIIPY